MDKKRILVTGGNTVLGLNIANALLAEGAEVTLLVRDGTQDTLGVLAQKVTWHVADVWDAASLRGRGRGHDVVVNTVGSMTADPAQGLTFHRLNVVSARNVANMCVSDGVERMVLLSTARMWWLPPKYIASKREAEAYAQRLGVPLTVIRSPLVYLRGEPRPLFYHLLSLLGALPLINLFGLRHIAPLPLDVLARGVAKVALMRHPKPRLYAPELRRLAKPKAR
jgi:uncharacterized protein YbjT (DUF2867 family)